MKNIWQWSPPLPHPFLTGETMAAWQAAVDEAIRRHVQAEERVHEARYERDANYIARHGLQQSFERRGA